MSLAALSFHDWHCHLGNPGDHVFDILRSNNLISCSRSNASKVCVLLVKLLNISILSFSPSFTHTYAPFDIVHSDIWTSPLLSKNGYCYYLVLLDDISVILFRFTLLNKNLKFIINFFIFVHLLELNLNVT